MNKVLLMLSTALVAMVTQAGIYDFGGTLVDVEYWAGEGANEAVLVLDFAPGRSYAFGYRWDGTNETGAGMLQTLSDAGDLEIDAIDFGPPTGLFVTGLHYKYNSMPTGSYPTNWLSYFTATDPSAWTDSWVGVSGRVLTSGDWDGFSIQRSADWPPMWPPTSSPTFKHVQVMRGVEWAESEHQKINNAWTKSRNAGSRRFFAVLYYDDPAADGSVRIASIQFVYYEQGFIPFM